VRVVRALEGGITNRNYLLDVRGEGRVVLRLSGKDTALLLIDREVERLASERAAALDLAPAVVAFIEPEQCLVTRFVDADPLPPEGIAEASALRLVAGAVRRFHDSPPLPGTFDCFTVPVEHAAAARQRGVAIPIEYDRALTVLRRIEEAFRTSPEPRRPCHNDLLNANLLWVADEHGERVWLLDWEYAGMNDRYFDLGNFAVNNQIGADAERFLLDAYFGAVTERHLARLALGKLLSDFREAMWAVVQQGISALDFDYAGYADRHFDRLLSSATTPQFESWLAAAAGPARADPPVAGQDSS
jgi:thiamine kinase-like enzyme